MPATEQPKLMTMRIATASEISSPSNALRPGSIGQSLLTGPGASRGRPYAGRPPLCTIGDDISQFHFTTDLMTALPIRSALARCGKFWCKSRDPLPGPSKSPISSEYDPHDQ